MLDARVEVALFWSIIILMIGTMGDGGMAVTNSEYLKNRMIALRNHGGAVRYYHDEIGVNSRLDEIHLLMFWEK